MEWRVGKRGDGPGLSVHAGSKTASETKWSAPNELRFWISDSARRPHQGFSAGL